MNTDTCARVISVGRHVGGTEVDGYAMAQTSNTFPNRVFVETYTDAGAQTDLPFSLDVTC